MVHQLPALPYEVDALEPHIDAQTMGIHHGKHHQAYVNNLNAALEAYPELQEKTVDELIAHLESVPEAIRTAVRNNGGGHANHSLFWTIVTPEEALHHQVSDELKKAIESVFGDMNSLKEAFSTAAKSQFGSGWAWLIVTKDGKLAVKATANQDSPLMQGDTPILGLDVWEHAYYLHYQNRRPDYVEAFWNIVNWAQVSFLYDQAMKAR